MAERQAITVRAELRAGRGKNDARRLRARGMVPLTVYGGEGEPVSAAAPLRELAAILRSGAGHNTIFTLDVEGVGANEVLFLDRQIDPVKGRLVHADLRRLVQGQEVEVTVRLELEGEPLGTKDEGGILEQLLREVEIRCRPGIIPDVIRADVSGLGNPGERYEWTRHNLGFMLVDVLARQSNALVKRAECRALVGRAEIEGRAVELAKPQTYMNLSGESVACLLKKRDGLNPAEDLLVVSDDIALPFGSIRLRPRGSSGGQKGLKSIISVLGTDEFLRLRIGIRPEHAVSDTSSFVLESFPKSQRDEVEKVLERSAEALRAVLRDGIDKAMSQYNSDQQSALSPQLKTKRDRKSTRLNSS